MTSLDREIAAFLLAGDHPILAALREQWAAATVTWVSIDANIYSQHLAVPAGAAPLFSKGRADINDVQADVVGVSEPVEFQLSIVKGLIGCLRGIAPSDAPWPENAKIKRCYYVGSDKAERSTRDVEWALREVIERQSDPARPYLDDLPELWGEEHEALVFRLVPEHGAADTVQGELLRAALRVCAEYYRNGCGNWVEDPESFNDFVEFLREHLCDGTFGPETEAFVRELLSLVRMYGESDDMSPSPADERVLDRDLERLEQLAAAWCLRHPDLIPWQSADGSKSETE